MSKELYHFHRTVREGSLLIDSSTISPDVAKEVASKVQDKGATYIDAPVSGGTVYTIKYYD